MYRIRNRQNVHWTIKEWACDIRPWSSVPRPEVDCSQLRPNGHQRIPTGYLQDAERMRAGQTAGEPDKQHTNARVTFINLTSLSGGVCSKI